MKPLRIGITGASGYIGQELVRLLTAQGHDLAVLSRSAKKFDNKAFIKVVEADLSEQKPEDIAEFTRDLDVL